VGGMRNGLKNLTEKLEGKKKPLGTVRSRNEDNIRMDLHVIR
jgi:hypothetical protein